MMRRGWRGNAVRGAQTLLRDAGLYEGRIDGRFGDMTDRAVREWQALIGVKADGLWGPITDRATVDVLSELGGIIPPVGYEKVR